MPLTEHFHAAGYGENPYGQNYATGGGGGGGFMMGGSQGDSPSKGGVSDREAQTLRQSRASQAQLFPCATSSSLAVLGQEHPQASDRQTDHLSHTSSPRC